jgi:hypothetical protein
VSDPSGFEVEMAIKELKRHKSLGTDQIPAVLIKARGRTFCYDSHELVYSAWNKDELPEEWKESIIVPIYRKGDKRIVLLIEAHHFLNLSTIFYPKS